MGTKNKMASQPVTRKVPAAPSDPPVQKVALPLHVQKLQGALNLDALIDQVERVFNESLAMEKVSVVEEQAAKYDSLCVYFAMVPYQ